MSPPTSNSSRAASPSLSSGTRTPTTHTHYTRSLGGSLLTRGSATQTMAPPTTGSHTQTQTSSSNNSQAPPLVLRLRGAHPPRQRRQIQWAAGTVDNEGLGRKRSKVCCIYHRAREVGESSSESDCSSSSSSSSDDDDDDSASESEGGAGGDGRAADRRRMKRMKRSSRRQKRDPSPNAYERIPGNSGRRQRHQHDHGDHDHHHHPHHHEGQDTNVVPGTGDSHSSVQT